MLALLVAAQIPASPVAEVWEPRISWGCVVSEGKGAAYVVNGVIAQRNEPANPNPHRRFETALRIVRDDSGAFAGLQARSPMFVVHPKAYWAFFASANGKPFGPAGRSIVLDKDAAQQPVKISLIGSGGKDAKPYATGRCISKRLSAEIKP